MSNLTGMSRRAFAACAVLLAAGLAVPASAAAPRTDLAFHPAYASDAAFRGLLKPDAPVQLQLVLPVRDEPGLRRLVAAVSDPASPSYAQYLTPQQFRSRYAARQTQVDQVRAWLMSQGLEVGTVPANHSYVPARGTAQQVSIAFHTRLGRFQHGTQQLHAPLTTPSVPAGLGVVGVRGLADELILEGPPLPDEPATPIDSAPPAAIVYAAPCSAKDGSTVEKLPLYGGKRPPAVTCGTTVAQQRAAYGVDLALKAKLDGTGQTVVIVGSHAVQTLPGDVAEWSRRRGLPALRPGQLTQLSYPSAYQTPTAEPYLRPQVWAFQSHLLVENLHAMAPGADVVYLGTTSSLDLTNGATLAVDAHLGDVVMNGWYSLGENSNPASMAQVDHTAMQAAAQGISLLFAAGSVGDNTSQGGTKGPESPASNDLVTSVGATSLLPGKAEVGWAKPVLNLIDGTWEDDKPATFRGGGGGRSALYAQPTYQAAVVPDAMAKRSDGTKGRTVPDLAVNGDAETGLVIGLTQRFTDGTDRYAERRAASDESATAIVAALVAVANQRAGHALGFLNPLLYALPAKAFRDIVPSGKLGARVRTDFVTGTSGATKKVLKPFEGYDSNVPARGYDTLTGRGAPSTSFLTLLGP